MPDNSDLLAFDEGDEPGKDLPLKTLTRSRSTEERLNKIQMVRI